MPTRWRATTVNAGVPKTLIAYLVRWYARHRADDELRAVLERVLKTPITPELIPSEDGEISQRTEAIIGPYRTARLLPVPLPAQRRRSREDLRTGVPCLRRLARAGGDQALAQGVLRAILHTTIQTHDLAARTQGRHRQPVPPGATGGCRTRRAPRLFWPQSTRLSSNDQGRKPNAPNCWYRYSRRPRRWPRPRTSSTAAPTASGCTSSDPAARNSPINGVQRATWCGSTTRPGSWWTSAPARRCASTRPARSSRTSTPSSLRGCGPTTRWTFRASSKVP